VVEADSKTENSKIVSIESATIIDGLCHKAARVKFTHEVDWAGIQIGSDESDSCAFAEIGFDDYGNPRITVMQTSGWDIVFQSTFIDGKWVFRVIE